MVNEFGYFRYEQTTWRYTLSVWGDTLRCLKRRTGVCGPTLQQGGVPRHDRIIR